MVDPTYEQALVEAAQELVDEYSPRIPAGRVMGAVARAREHVRDGYDALLVDAPSADEYVSLIVGLVRRQLDDLLRRVERAGGPLASTERR